MAISNRSISPYVRPRGQPNLKELEASRDAKQLAIKTASLKLLSKTLTSFQDSLKTNNLYLSGRLLDKFEELEDQVLTELYKLENK